MTLIGVVMGCTIPTCVGLAIMSNRIGELQTSKMEEILKKDKAYSSAFIPIEKWRNQNFFKKIYTLPRWDKN